MRIWGNIRIAQYMGVYFVNHTILIYGRIYANIELIKGENAGKEGYMIMNEEISKMISDARERTAHASDCLNAWRGKFDPLFTAIVDDPNAKPLFRGMNAMELSFQSAYEWMEENYDVLASNIRIVSNLVEEADYLLSDIEMEIWRDNHREEYATA